MEASRLTSRSVYIPVKESRISIQTPLGCGGEYMPVILSLARLLYAYRAIPAYLYVACAVILVG
jgi:hypothetical protein